MNTKKTIIKKKPQSSGLKLFYSIGSIFILVLAALAFVLIPALASGTKQKEIIIGKWNKKPIKYAANTEFMRNIEYFSNFYKYQGYEINSQSFYSILNDAFNTTVLNMAVIEQVDKAGYIPAQNAVNRALLPYFYDTEGKYSAKIFRDTPDSKKIEYTKSIINNLKYTSYMNDYISQQTAPYYGIKTSKNESLAFAKMNGRKKAFDYVAFSTNEYPPEQAQLFAKENLELFTEHNFSVLSFNTESQAKSIMKQLQQNEITFFDAVQNFSTKNYSGDDGIFSYSYQYQIKPLLSSEEDFETLLSLKIDEISPILKTSNTYSIFKVNAEPKLADISSKQLSDLALNYLQQYEMGRVQDYFISLANDFAINASIGNFATTANKFSLSIESLESFPLNFGNSSLLDKMPTQTTNLSGAETNENLLKTIFSLNKGEVSSPIILDNNVLVFQCTEAIDDFTESDVEKYTITYADYSRQFIESAFYEYFLKSEKTENNVFNVYLEYFYQ